MADSYSVLVVEDDREHAELISEMLRISGPFHTTTVTCLSELWLKLREEQPDVMLLDYRLPDGTGLQALEEIARQSLNMPVIMITAQGDQRTAYQAVQLGAADYLVKDSSELIALPALVRKIMRDYELQRSLNRSLEQIRYQALLLNNVRDAVVVWNLDGKITYVNPAAQALFGWSRESLLAMPAESYMRGFTPPVRIPIGEGTGGLRVERTLASQGGKATWVSSHVYALRDQNSNGRLMGYMDVCRDITERKQMEAQVRNAQTQLMQAARLAAIGELASGVAHHINNPLTTVIAESQILLQSLPDDHPNRDSASAIEQAGWRVQKAVQQLLDFSQPPSNTLEVLNVNDTIWSAVNLVGDPIRSQNAELKVELADSLPYLRGNTHQLVDLWVNMLMLARGSASNGHLHAITIRTCAPTSCSIQVEISDNGEPIPPAEMDTLFDPSFLKELGGRGTGIELAICQEIVRQYRGQITAESNSNDVTIFRVTLPAEV